MMDTSIHYDNHASRWEFYLRSYLGGLDYQEGEYLHKYINESEDEYSKRLTYTPLDNHAKNVIQIYSSFIWRRPVIRDLGFDADEITEDADLEGNDLNAVMAEASDWASVYGHCWLIMDKPETTAKTRAEELGQGIRPYISIYTPENVPDWEYTRSESGRFTLSRLVVLEGAEGDIRYYREWTPEQVKLIKEDGDSETVIEDKPNPLGRIPAVCLYSQKSTVRGVGISDLSDVADIQRAIYNELSEIEQLIRISNHPSLVKGATTDASAGAGSVITKTDDDEVNPYLLQPSAASLDGIRNSITDKVEAINRITHIGAVRATEKKVKSGVALQTEFQLLNAKLSQKARHLELAEEQLWGIYATWQGLTYDGTVEYADSFDLRDVSSELALYQSALTTNTGSTTYKKEVLKNLARLVTVEEMHEAIAKEIDGSVVTLGKFE